MILSCKTDDIYIDLDRGKELQFTVCEPDGKIWLELITGSAEILGAELQANKNYEFSYFSSVAVFTSFNCTLKLKKKSPSCAVHEVVTSTQIPEMRELHSCIETMRMSAEENFTEIPITLIAGPTDVGKSTLCRFLMNYAAKYGRKPIFIDLDVGQSSLSITGTLGVLPVHEPSDVNGRFDEKSLSVYYFGYKSPGHNMPLYKLLLHKLGRSLNARKRRLSDLRSSGILIDTCGWIDGGGFQLIKEVIEVLEVNMVFVLSSKALYRNLKHEVSERTEVQFVNKLAGVVTRDKYVRNVNRDASVHRYFYGLSGRLQPHTIKVNFNELQIFQANISKRDCKTSAVLPVHIEPDILNQVLGLSYAEKVENIPITSVYGFVCITEIDMDSETATLLSPQPGPLPTNYLLIGDNSFTPSVP